LLACLVMIALQARINVNSLQAGSHVLGQEQS